MAYARKQKIQSPLAMRDGVSASRVWLPKQSGTWTTILDFLVERFPFINQSILKERMQRGDIVDQQGQPFTPHSPYSGEQFLFYYREIPDEPVIPFQETILYQDDRIIVVDKPHFIPVTPTGRFVKQSLLARLKHRFQNEAISPIHRLDRETAGVMLFTCDPAIRGAYQTLFQNREVDKSYEAIAIKSEHSFPLTYRSRIEKSEPFFIMQETAGEPNSETTLNLLETRQQLARYELKPVTGKQHQLRVHMMALGMPILNDPFYPELLPCKGEDYSQPLQLLARRISFTDPLSGKKRSFESERKLIF